MSQKFHTSTLVSKYIKYLLSYTPLPLYPMIEHSHPMIEGCLYIYKDRVLKCTKSGVFSAVLPEDYPHELGSLVASDQLTVQNEKDSPNYLNIYESTITADGVTYSYRLSPLCVTDDYCFINNINFAEYDIVNGFKMNELIPGVTQRYISSSHTYDSTTHKYLGQYLRLLKNQYNLDLMSLYNCFAQEVVEDIMLHKSEPFITSNNTSTTKVLLVPIKFNQTYTIAIDCNTNILLKAIVYNRGLVTSADNQYISDLLEDTTIQKSCTQFGKPFTYKITNTENKNLQQYENNLYLAIQVPMAFSDALSVIEGDYTFNQGILINDISILHVNDPNRVLLSMSNSPSLLNLSDAQYRPFSDKLISYLLRNTIDSREFIDENVSRVEKDINYKPEHYGLWDDSIRYIIHQKYNQLSPEKRRSNYDILGYIDLDVEDAIRKGYIKYGN